MFISNRLPPVPSRHNLLLPRRRHRAPMTRGGREIDRPLLRASPSLLLPLQAPLLLLLLLLSERVSTASAESSICDRRFVLRQRDSGSAEGTEHGTGAEPRSSSSEANERSYGANGAGGALSRGRGFMGAAMVEDPAVVVFAGGIGSGGTVVDSNVDAFSLGAGALAGGGGAGDDGGGVDGVVVDRDVLS